MKTYKEYNWEGTGVFCWQAQIKICIEARHQMCMYLFLALPCLAVNKGDLYLGNILYCQWNFHECITFGQSDGDNKVLLVCCWSKFSTCWAHNGLVSTKCFSHCCQKIYVSMYILVLQWKSKIAFKLNSTFPIGVLVEISAAGCQCVYSTIYIFKLYISSVLLSQVDC